MILPEAVRMQPGILSDAPLRGPDSTSAWSALEPIALDSDALLANAILTRRSGPETRPFDALRARVRQRMAASGWQRLAVISPSPRHGTSTVALNLAFALARCTEERVVSIEGNLSAPSHCRLLAQPPVERSSVLFLEGRQDFAATAVRAGPNLAMSFATHPREDASDILQNADLAGALDQVETLYRPTITVLDAPPILDGDAGLALLGHADCALIVARADRATRTEIDRAERLAAEYTNVLGVALNACRFA